MTNFNKAFTLQHLEEITEQVKREHPDLAVVFSSYEGMGSDLRKQVDAAVASLPETEKSKYWKQKAEWKARNTKS